MNEKIDDAIKTFWGKLRICSRAPLKALPKGMFMGKFETPETFRSNDRAF